MTFAQFQEGIQMIQAEHFIPEDAKVIFAGTGMETGYIRILARDDKFAYDISANLKRDGGWKMNEGYQSIWYRVI